MYDHEIESALSLFKNDLPAETYQYICSTSPQILRVRYLPFENKFEVWTNCSYWKFSVHPQ